MDREKVIKGVHQHCEGSMFDRCGECPYYEIDHEPFICRDMLLNDLSELLKEQEPIEPVDDRHGSLICGNQGYGCGCVGRYDLTTKVVEKYCNFCPECGRKVKWE